MACSHNHLDLSLTASRNSSSGHRYDLLSGESTPSPESELDRLSLHPVSAEKAPAGSGGSACHTHSNCEQSGRPQIVRYASLIELRDYWKALDRIDDALRLTVILVLGDNFCGHLPGLIRRTHPALRLLISSPSGRLPGLTSIGDLALHSSRYGWHLISVHRPLEDAVSAGMSPLAWHERCVMFVPEQTKARSAATPVNAAALEYRWM
ncbi:hypothetical protein [Planctomicrobium piriforme]|uniref:Uncharacterized protein n=1 Tax=Planctomicrobium piriforme TaxID=1576369 RepID=A0A1I3QZB5_9PLAN|nr:hypothetical protein [Planctomicrobium piriforme]SFJ39225.1 hypothetical protein SAMN05421753_119103 [Planctomicrobium piriforme]